MANYTCEFSKTSNGKYAQVPNENTAKRCDLGIPEKYHTPLRNLDKYKITKNKYDEEYTYSREFKFDKKGVETDDSGNVFIFCAFKNTDDVDDVIYIKHDDLTSKAKEEAGAYDVYIRGEDDAYGNGTFTVTKDETTTYTFLWL